MDIIIESPGQRRSQNINFPMTEPVQLEIYNQRNFILNNQPMETSKILSPRRKNERNSMRNSTFSPKKSHHKSKLQDTLHRPNLSNQNSPDKIKSPKELKASEILLTQSKNNNFAKKIFNLLPLSKLNKSTQSW
jgi:hypothetical protein